MNFLMHKKYIFIIIIITILSSIILLFSSGCNINEEIKKSVDTIQAEKKPLIDNIQNTEELSIEKFKSIATKEGWTVTENSKTSVTVIKNNSTVNFTVFKTGDEAKQQYDNDINNNTHDNYSKTSSNLDKFSRTKIYKNETNYLYLRLGATYFKSSSPANEYNNVISLVNSMKYNKMLLENDNFYKTD